MSREELIEALKAAAEEFKDHIPLAMLLVIAVGELEDYK